MKAAFTESWIGTLATFGIVSLGFIIWPSLFGALLMLSSPLVGGLLVGLSYQSKGIPKYGAVASFSGITLFTIALFFAIAIWGNVKGYGSALAQDLPIILTLGSPFAALLGAGGGMLGERLRLKIDYLRPSSQIRL